MARDHGGNLDAAMARFGGTLADWIDLSTGINPCPYPVPPIDPGAWAHLPRATDMQRLCQAARRSYGTQAEVIPFAGAQGAIQAMPFLRPAAKAHVLGPTYNEHAAALRMGGWHVSDVPSLVALEGAELAVVVNPNNPDGRRDDPMALAALAKQVGLLVVDESFADPMPGQSLAPLVHGLPNVIVLRSFGKFYGLAGVRLGFALATGGLAQRLRALAGPWPVSGPAIDIARAALSDTQWQSETTQRLKHDAARLDQATTAAGWSLVGGTPLFRTYACADAAAAQQALARAHIWTRIFPYSAHWIRLGLPGNASDWARLETALARPGQ